MDDDMILYDGSWMIFLRLGGLSFWKSWYFIECLDIWWLAYVCFLGLSFFLCTPPQNFNQIVDDFLT